MDTLVITNARVQVITVLFEELVHVTVINFVKKSSSILVLKDPPPTPHPPKINERSVSFARRLNTEVLILFVPFMFSLLQGPVRFYDNERKASILLKQFQSMVYHNMCACISVCMSAVSEWFGACISVCMSAVSE